MPYGTDVIFDNEQNLMSLFKSIHEYGSESNWLEEARRIRKDKRLEVLIYMAASLASVLVEPCGALPFIVSLWGGTGLGKTVALMLATSIWADPGEGAYMTDAKATSTAMEVRLDTLNSLPMTLDDMAQIKNQYDGDFSELVYRWCAGKGRDRSNQSLGLNKLTSWKNCTLTNGERSLVTDTMQGGAVNRIIDVEIEDRPLFKDAHRTANVLRSNYGFCGKQFVRAIQALGFDEVNAIAEKYAEKIKAYSSDQGQDKEEKQIIPMSLILAADEISEEFIYQDGIRLSVDDVCNLLKNKGDVSENKRAFEYLTGVIASNYSKFDPDNNDYHGEIWGKGLGGTKTAIIGTVFDKIMKQGGFQTKSFLSWANREGLLECDGKQLKKKVSINDSRPRCVVIDMRDDDEELIPAEDIPF